MKKWLLRRNLKVLQNFSDINKDDCTGSNEISLSEEWRHREKDSETVKKVQKGELRVCELNTVFFLLNFSLQKKVWADWKNVKRD